MFGRRRDREFYELISSEHSELRGMINRQNEDFRHQTEDLRQFIHEITLRNEKVWQGVMAELREMKEESRDMREQIQANTKAVLAALERFEASGGQAQA